jgi:hypothetical protein
MSTGKDLQGEGNYEASRRYRERTEQFIESGRVEEAAKKAAPRSDEEAQELDRAEELGQSHMAEEDPQLRD